MCCRYQGTGCGCEGLWCAAYLIPFMVRCRTRTIRTRLSQNARPTTAVRFPCFVCVTGHVLCERRSQGSVAVSWLLGFRRQASGSKWAAVPVHSLTLPDLSPPRCRISRGWRYTAEVAAPALASAGFATATFQCGTDVCLLMREQACTCSAVCMCVRLCFLI